MSVSLVVLRLEVADDSQSIPSFAFQAEHFKNQVKESENKWTYAEVAARSNPVLEASGPIFSAEDLSSCRGRRHFSPITIETYHTEEAVVCEIMEKLDLDGGTSSPRELSTSESSPRDGGPILTSGAKVRTSRKASSEEGACAMPSGILRDSACTRQRTPSKSTSFDESHDPTAMECDDGERSRPSSAKHSKSPSPGIQDTIHFFSGNPSVEITEGILHLYKESQMTSLTDDVPRSEMIAILTVPAIMTSQDLMQFIAPVEPWVENMKIVRDGTPNVYMVLVKFKSQKYADEFYNNYNNKPFNMIEEETCHLVYVAKVETMKAEEGAGCPQAGLTELPVCPVCLERMEESVDGVLTILCNHSFHSSCLAQWGDTSCPVCRYIQTPEPVEDHKCFQCDSTDSLWICLICGHVGCGRYVGGHAYSHFQQTQHTYSLQLGNNRVWDYAGDNYVHRLIQSKEDGKLVEVDEGGNIMQDEKLDSITLEYTYLLTSQLEHQRHYFEERMEHLEKESLKHVEEMELRCKAAGEECMRMEQRFVTTNKEKQGHERKSSTLQVKVNRLTTELKEEKEMNKSLLSNQAQWQERVKVLEGALQKKDEEVKELQEQLRDVMFYLEAQQKLANTTEVSQAEIQDGHVIVGGATASGSSGKKSRKKGR